jgi:hypothetical protein
MGFYTPGRYRWKRLELDRLRKPRDRHLGNTAWNIVSIGQATAGGQGVGLRVQPVTGDRRQARHLKVG